MKKVTYASCHITGGFWANMQKLIRETSMHAVYNRFDETGRIGAFRCDWKEGMDNKPHYYWDSDVAKWMESVAYIIRKYPNQELEEAVETLIDQIEKNQGADGYFNIYFTVVMPEKRFSNRDWHELYCAGHLIEAAVAWYETTGRDRFLHMMCRYADYIEKVFIIDGSAGYVTPGHEEIELALVKLYDVTGEKRYIKMVQFFLDHRGYNEKNEGDSINIQAHKPVREQYTAEGHAVRAMYLACAMADVALRMGDKNLKFACEKMFENIINQRMYITGGIGSSAVGEAFTVDYDLPNITAYTETCAAIGLALFAQRMMLLDMNGVYGDVIEKVLYNGFLSGISLDGKAFFYENPLEIPPAEQKAPGVRYPITKRLEVFRCSCCPPNITRFVSSVGDFLYTVDEKGIYCHQFMESVYEGEDFTLMMKTDYPHSGKVRFDYRGQPTTLFVRVPGWCDGL
ncbi:MAG TPA: hypothetical protein DCY74_10590 [Clostridiales bacterium]|nr:hypothetical protein [Clostridiales bacterium]